MNSFSGLPAIKCDKNPRMILGFDYDRFKELFLVQEKAQTGPTSRRATFDGRMDETIFITGLRRLEKYGFIPYVDQDQKVKFKIRIQQPFNVHQDDPNYQEPENLEETTIQQRAARVAIIRCLLAGSIDREIGVKLMNDITTKLKDEEKDGISTDQDFFLALGAGKNDMDLNFRKIDKLARDYQFKLVEKYPIAGIDNG